MNIKFILTIIIFDILIGTLFVFSNLSVWNFLNGKLTINNWGPYEIIIVPQTIVNGTASVVGTYTGEINYPFILFWIALIGNLVLSIIMMKAKNEMKDF